MGRIRFVLVWYSDGYPDDVRTKCLSATQIPSRCIVFLFFFGSLASWVLGCVLFACFAIWISGTPRKSTPGNGHWCRRNVFHFVALVWTFLLRQSIALLAKKTFCDLINYPYISKCCNQIDFRLPWECAPVSSNAGALLLAFHLSALRYSPKYLWFSSKKYRTPCYGYFIISL